MPPLYLFDIDWTLIRGGTPAHKEAFAHAYREIYGLDLSLDGIPAAGRTDTWLLAEPLRRRGMSDRDIWACMPEAFALMEQYVDERLDDMRDWVLPGVREVLALLRSDGGLLGLLTGNLSRIASAKMRHAGLDGYFTTGGFGEESETRAHLVFAALAHAAAHTGTNIPPQNAVVIGDTPFDIEAGRAAGTRTAGIATGPFSEDDLRAAGADLVLPSFADAQQAAAALTYQVSDS
jgi:phosphoglycolate phosphatase-like HAD superfamily hydrolase